MTTQEYRDMFDLILDGSLYRIGRDPAKNVEIAPLMCALLRVLPEAEGLKLRAAFEPAPAVRQVERVPA
jgi:hypothetical protein